MIIPTKDCNLDEKHYEELIAKEAKHWGVVAHDPQNPQLWDDERLFELFFGREYRHMVERVGATGPRVLELGCGEGTLAIDLARRGLQVDAIDLSEDRIVRAKSRIQGAARPHFIVGDLNVIALQPDTYDCIVAHDALHHILNLDHLFTEVNKALKQHGTFVVMDFIGMGRVRKLCAAIMTALLPTYQPYRKKLHYARRLPAFLATEEQKREALSSRSTDALHQDSPFEEISQKSIRTLMHRHFCVVEDHSFNPFWYYLVPKVRMPASIRYHVARMLHAVDNAMVRTNLMHGAYVFMEARKA